MHLAGSFRFVSILAGFIFILTASARAQALLDKKISIDVRNQRLGDVLKLISNKGNFYFSYNSRIIQKDSLVSVSASQVTVKELLDRLFSHSLEYRISNNYIILHKTVEPASSVTGPAPVADKLYTISGYVLDGETGEKISNVSIYEKRRLVSTLSDNKGFFEIQLKSRFSTASLTVSRDTYEDTTITVRSKYNQHLVIVMEPVHFYHTVVTITPFDYETPDTIINNLLSDSISAVPAPQGDVDQVEKTEVGRFLLSAKQRIQALNLGRFFADRPFQVSVIPGVGSHGKLSGQVINNVSFNLLGGYTGGTEGIELGGLFNINKKNMKGAQFAGLFNIVGGPVNGIQIAGIHNTSLKPVKALQTAGISNFVRGKFTGLQISGIHNHVTDSVTGWQLAGISNYARKKVTGAQISGIGNFSNRQISGLQVAGIFNYAKILHGVQIGLINIADTSNGYSIGLINFVAKGYHKIVLSTNEALNLNLAYKSGNKKLYSILLAGLNKNDTAQAYSIGYGLGTEFSLGKTFSLNPELSSQYLYLGDFENGNLLNRLELLFNIKLGKFITLFAGPAFSVYYGKQTTAVEGYKFTMPSAGYHTFDLWGDKTTGWFGWNAGISLF